MSKNFKSETELMRSQVPVPLRIVRSVNVKNKKVGLGIIDAIDGFCTVGAGKLAPVVPNINIDRAIDRIDGLARKVLGVKGEVLTERDVHAADTPEYPYPGHCIKGSGEELLVKKLRWLNGTPGVTDSVKHCINALIGTMRFGGGNGVIEWIVKHQLEVIVLSGFCTDICLLEYALTLMSIKNMRQLQFLEKVVVIPDACATYDLPLEVAESLGDPSLAHPSEIFHHMGLALMQKSGIILADNIDV